MDRKEVTAYPNPLRDVINLAMDCQTIASLLNHAGVVVETRNLWPGQNKLDLSHLPAGAYLIHFEESTRIAPVRVIKN